jgi:hypothetical protein
VTRWVGERRGPISSTAVEGEPPLAEDFGGIGPAFLEFDASSPVRSLGITILRLWLCSSVAKAGLRGYAMLFVLFDNKFLIAFHSGNF